MQDRLLERGPLRRRQHRLQVRRPDQGRRKDRLAAQGRCWRGVHPPTSRVHRSSPPLRPGKRAAGLKREPETDESPLPTPFQTSRVPAPDGHEPVGTKISHEATKTRRCRICGEAALSNPAFAHSAAAARESLRRGRVPSCLYVFVRDKLFYSGSERL